MLLKIAQDNIINFSIHSDQNKFIKIMECKDPIVLAQLGSYIYTCLKKRNMEGVNVTT